MKMFWSKYRNDQWQNLWELLVTMQSQIRCLLRDKPTLVECGVCGCAIMNAARWKAPSTIITDPPRIFGGLAGAAAAQNAYPGAVQGLQQPYQFGVTSPSERIVEHYICGRCRPSMEAKQ